MDEMERTVRQSVSIPAGIAKRVRTLAKTRKTSANRVLVDLIEAGLQAKEAEKERFFALLKVEAVGKEDPDKADKGRAKDREKDKDPDPIAGLLGRIGEELVSKAFDDVEFHLARMDRQGVNTSVLSLLGAFCWIESQPVEVSLPLCRMVNDALSGLCQKYQGRFSAFAALPLVEMSAAAAEFERALGLPGVVGAQVPGNGFLTKKDAENMRPLLEVANRHRAIVFIHHGPRPGDAFPKVSGDTDNARRRNGTLDMQASLSSVMVTLCLTDYLAPYPDATVLVHNLGGNIPYEIERMDHRSLLDTAQEELPSSRFRRAKVYVDCNSFGPGAIEAAVRLYGADRIVCGTDGTEFGCEWTSKALAEAQIGEDAREKILHRNAAAMMSRLAKVAQRQTVAA